MKCTQENIDIDLMDVHPEDGILWVLIVSQIKNFVDKRM